MEKFENKSDPDVLRQKAEEQLKERRGKTSPAHAESNEKLLHEMEVHQIELELVNQELLNTIEVVNGFAGKSEELINSLPIGYLIINREWIISEVNLHGAQMLGKSGLQLQGIRFDLFVSDDTKIDFQNFLATVFTARAITTCEVCLIPDGKEICYILLSGMVQNNDVLCTITMQDITERKQLEKITTARGLLLQFSENRNLDDVLEETINHAENITGSLIGFFHFVDQDQSTLSLQNWSTRTKRGFCQAEGKGEHYAISLAGVWADCIRESRPIIHNNYAALHNKQGLPPGHANIVREMVVPVFYGMKIVAVLGVGNKPTDYTEKDLHNVSILADLTWEIASRKKTEEALRQREILWANAFNSSPLLMTISDAATGRYLDVNESFSAISEYSKEEAIGKTSVELGWITTRDSEWMTGDLLKNGKIEGVEVSLCSKSGKEIICSLSGVVLDTPQGRKLFSTALDITARRHLEDKFVAEQALRMAVESSLNHGIAIVDFDGQQIYVNHSFCNLLGWEEKELLGKSTPFVYWPNDQLASINEAFQKTLANQAPTGGFDLVFVRKDKARIPVQVIISPFGDGKRQIGWLANVIDITDRKKTESELLKKDTLLNLTGYSAKVGGWEFDTETLEQTWTDEVYRIHEIDYPFEPTVNNGIGFYAGNSRKAIEKAVRHAVECGAPFDLELEFITAKGNHRWVHSIGKALLEDGKVTKVYGSIQDITDQKLADNEVHRLNENLELLVAERTRNLEIAYQELIFHLNEIEQFTYISNHDLQEPLRTISLYSQLLKEEFSDKLGQDGKQYIDFMHNSATRMKAMVKGLFDYSLVGTTGEIKIVDCKMLFESVLSGLQFAINESQAEITICSLPTISCFEAELSMLFQNLLSNAIKFHRPDNRPLIEVSARELETEWLFSVNDNGIGIDEKYAEKIFIIFQRLHNRNEYTGTGIGLAQCKKIVKLHGGRIWVESQVGKGSTFMFTIPKKLSVVNFQHQLSQNIHAPGS